MIVSKGRLVSAELSVNGEKVVEITKKPDQSTLLEQSTVPKLEDTNMGGRKLSLLDGLQIRTGNGHFKGKKLYV